MKSSLVLFLCAATLASAFAHPKDPQIVLQEPQLTIVEPDEYLIELSPGETRWVTEEEKWELRRVRHVLEQFSPSRRELMIASKTSTSLTSPTMPSSAP